MANEKARLVAQTTTNSYTGKQLSPNPNQEGRGLQGNSRTSLAQAQKIVRIPREGVTGDRMPLKQVVLGLREAREDREAREAKMPHLKITKMPHLKISKEPWFRIRTLWQYHNHNLCQCGILKAPCRRNNGKCTTVARERYPEITTTNSNDNHNIALPQPTL